MRVWVTRPEPDASALKRALLAQGHDVVIEPLMWIDFDAPDPIEIDGAQALIATSRNGVRAIAASDVAEFARTLPLFAVGRGTAQAAKEAGFADVIVGPARSADLVQVIETRAEIHGGPLVHLAGETLAHDMAGELRRLGFVVLQPVVYAARMAERLSTAFLPKLVLGEIDAVILLSPRTASTYVELIQSHQLLRSARKLHHYCMSQAVADQLVPLQPDVIKVPNRPNIHELLALTGLSAARSN
ncbi:MAG: uroporphyrinogen-III synthase [Hyphomicrobiaceae bacterium]|nr:uroporphyrinogen-III synthase [Hyphomicrobiaceae bacterium]